MSYKIVRVNETSFGHFNVVALVDDNLIISYFDLHLEGFDIICKTCFMDYKTEVIIQPTVNLYNLADDIIKEFCSININEYPENNNINYYLIILSVILFFISSIAI